MDEHTTSDEQTTSPANEPVVETSPSPVPGIPYPYREPEFFPKRTFGQYLRTDVVNHIKLLSIVGAIILAVILFNYVRDLQEWKSEQQKINATLAQKYQQVGPAAVSGNTQDTQAVVNAEALAAFGSSMRAIMAEQDAKIASLTTAVGIINAQQTAMSKQPATFTPHQQASSGALTGYVMQESRADGPPLDAVDLYYNPAEKNPNKAFAGTYWTHYREKFTANFGNWIREKDGGYRNTVSLTRTVSKPDPNDPGHFIDLGTEVIPISGSSTVYTPAGLLAADHVTDPRWTLSLGLLGNQHGKYGYGSLDYRVTHRFGIFAGAADSGVLGGISIRFGGN